MRKIHLSLLLALYGIKQENLDHIGYGSVLLFRHLLNRLQKICIEPCIESSFVVASFVFHVHSILYILGSVNMFFKENKKDPRRSEGPLFMLCVSATVCGFCVIAYDMLH